MTEPMIRAVGIEKAFGRTVVLSGIDLSVPRGTVFALLGPNGAGKTTMVRILSTLIRPDRGAATVAGHDVVRQPRRVREQISLTGQFAAVDELLTGKENLLMMGRLAHLDRRDVQDRATELLERFDLHYAADRRVTTYSGGMRRRLDLAVSLLGKPAVIFLDEPTTGLDLRSRLTMWEAVRELASSGVTIFLSTQYLEEADQLADRIAVLGSGQVIAEGSPAELKRRVASEQVELFLDAQNYPRAVRSLGDRAAHADRDLRTVRVPTAGSAEEVRRLLDQLAADGIAVDRIAVLTPSLDDVFLMLTDRTAAPRSSEPVGSSR